MQPGQRVHPIHQSSNAQSSPFPARHFLHVSAQLRDMHRERAGNRNVHAGAPLALARSGTARFASASQLSFYKYSGDIRQRFGRPFDGTVKRTGLAQIWDHLTQAVLRSRYCRLPLLIPLPSDKCTKPAPDSTTTAKMSALPQFPAKHRSSLYPATISRLHIVITFAEPACQMLAISCGTI